MTQFHYRARDQSGAAVAGFIQAPDPNAAADQLSSMGYIPILIREKKNWSTRISEWSARMEKVRIEDLIMFTRQLATMYRAGIPLISALRVIREQTESKHLKHIVAQMIIEVETGSSLAQSMERHPGVFSELYTGMINAGEMGGVMDEVLSRLAQLLHFDLHTRQCLKAAIRYPMLVIIVLAVAFNALMIFVVPKFVRLFEGRAALPLPTQIMIFLNTIFQQYWYALLVFSIVLISGFFLVLKSRRGRLTWDHFKLKLPIFGPLFLKVAMTRFAHMVETLNRTGMPIIRTMEIVSRTLGNSYISQEVQRVSRLLEEGKGLARPLNQRKIFPPLVIHMIAIGEESGTIEELLHEVANHYDMEVEYHVSRLNSMIEPVLTIGLGLVVMFFALAIFLPWWDMLRAFKRLG
ncbi:MAG: type II secretion system F family protein [Deltaproteobacteria bacterium]|nr:type II secretion system F family protein [Deltaproteobacteria bacterium]